MPRILAIDPGRRRMGLALSDPLRLFASPLGVIEYRDDKRFVDDMRALAARHDVALVLVGFPARDDGYEGEGCRRSRRLLGLLEGAGIHAMLWDESSSTERAYDVTRQHGLDRRKSRQAKDSIAASFILASYLEEHPGEGDRRV